MTQGLARFAAAACLAASSLTALEASAAPLTLRLSDGTTSIEVADNMTGDLNPLIGAVTFLGALGDFTVNVTTGVSYPVSGSQDSAHMQLNSIDIAGDAAAGTLTISLSHTDFLTTGPIRFLAESSGIVSPASATISYDTFLGSDNALFSLGTLLTELDFMGGMFSGGDSADVNTLAPYSLTQVVSVAFPGGFTSINLNASLQVPEPATLALFALALAGLGFGSRLRAGALRI